jgi:hypothetical protein
MMRWILTDRDDGGGHSKMRAAAGVSIWKIVAKSFSTSADQLIGCSYLSMAFGVDILACLIFPLSFFG